MDLSELRKQIDTLDDEILELYLQRLALTDQVADRKQTQGRSTADPGREQAILDRLTRGREAQAEEIRALYAHIFALSRARQDRRRAGRNLVLIGMPGSGKTTVGRLLGALSGRPVVDLDEVIAERTGCTIENLISRQGEEAFRALETQAAAEFGQQSGLILVTGGGIVERPENLPLLGQNGRIYQLLRDLDRLPAENRPLSQGQGVEALWQRRKALYEAFRDRTADNNGPADQTARSIWADFCKFAGLNGKTTLEADLPEG